MRILLLVLTSTLARAAWDPPQRLEMFDFLWQHIHDRFYDPAFRGVNWNHVRDEIRPQIEAAEDPLTAVELLRAATARLKHSHVGVVTPAERELLRSALPMFFDKVDGRYFVSHVFPTKPSVGIQVNLRYGDQILKIEDGSLDAMHAASVTHTSAVSSNPYFGKPRSIAVLRLRRDGKRISAGVPYLNRWDDVVSGTVELRPDRIAVLRLLHLDARATPPAELQRLLAQAARSEALVLDLRDCAGGDSQTHARLAGFFFGAGQNLSRVMARGKPQPISLLRSTDAGVRYQKPVAVVVNENTQSEAEALVAELKEYRRARLVGRRTRGAWNGWTEAFALPHGAGFLIVPITRIVSPMGLDYEGSGIAPDEEAANRPADYKERRDRVLEAAVSHLQKLFSASVPGD